MSQLNLTIDPTIGGWLIELLYFIVSVSCWRSARKLALNYASAPFEHHVWQAIAALFFALCITRHFGLETALTEASRKLAFLEGWYNQRRGVQLAIIVLMAISFIFAEILLMIWSRNKSLTASATLALMSATFVMAYLIIRSISFHSVDQIVGERLLGLSVNWILQLGGIGVVLMASVWRNKQIA